MEYSDDTVGGIAGDGHSSVAFRRELTGYETFDTDCGSYDFAGISVVLKRYVGFIMIFPILDGSGFVDETGCFEGGFFITACGVGVGTLKWIITEKRPST